MSSPLTDEIVALEDALEKRDATISRLREILDRAHAIVKEAVAYQIWHDDGPNEEFFRETLADIDAALNEEL
jgi:hypothetical protein